MSQLIDRLNRVSKAVAQPMGFRSAKTDLPKPQMQLIVKFDSTDNIGSLADYVAVVDAGVVRITKPGSEAKILKKLIQSLSDVPWGGWLGDIGEKGVGTIVEAGCDFLVFSAASPVLAIPQDNKVGKILQIESSLNENLLKAVNDLPVDAVLTVGEPENSLTWHQLMLFQRFASLLTKPLLVSIPSNVTATELKTLWGVGVDGVVIEVSTGQPVEELKGLRQAIDDLASLPPRKRGKIEALLPHIGEAAAEAEEEEE